MLSHYDIRFLRELRIYADAETADFRQRVSACSSIEEVKYWTGYTDALDRLIEECEIIERRLTSGNEQ
jgi:hypothetical protein